MSEPLRVAVGVLADAAGRILITRRHADRHQGNRWEFPGGKIEPGESVDAALAREFDEELGVAVGAAEPLIRIPWRYAERSVILEVRRVVDYRGEPRGLEGQPLRWVAPGELDPDGFPAANRPIITALNLPAHYVISPDLDDPDVWLAGLEACLQRGERLVQLRVRAGAIDRERLARAALERCHAAGARLLINEQVDLVRRIGADGVHLPARSLHRLSQRPLPPDCLVAASCHDPDELRLARDQGVDVVTLSPVAATPSHPDATPLGWAQFADWAAEAAMPVYALGGMHPADVATAREQGGQGVAGIRGFWG